MIMAVDFEYIKIDIEQVKETYVALRDLVYEDMDKQYKENKIHGPDYANTWAQLMQGVISGTLNAIVALQSKETEADRCIKYAQCEEIGKESARRDCESESKCSLTDQQEKKVKYETESALPAQVALHVRQEAGFDDNIRQKLMEAQLNSWAMMFSSGLLESYPCFIDSDEASTLYAGILAKTMPTYTPPAPGTKCPAAAPAP